MSLAATTTASLTIIDASSLKRQATSYESRRTPVLAPPKAHVWSSDNTTLYLASSNSIHSFSPISSVFTILYDSPQGSSLQPVLVSRDKSTLIFAQGSAIHLLAVGLNSPKITSSLMGHSAPVVSLSLCNDASLLASSSSAGTLCVHNLAHSSLTVLKGLPTSPGSSSKNLVCTFHPHTRTRLLVGCGKTLVIYDTTRPSGPVKSIALCDKDNSSPIPNIGHVVAISCSPFSKTLTAVAFNSGFIALVDLEKDRPFFKNLNVNVPVTSMTFTAEGSSVALGTENGKVIIQDLRPVEHDRRTLPVGDEGKGERIIGLSIQRRLKSSISTSSSTASTFTASTANLPTSLSAPLGQYDLNNTAAIVKSPTRRVVSSSPTTKTRVNPITPLKGRATREKPPKRAFSPPKVAVTGGDSGDISVQIDTLMGGGGNVEPLSKDPGQGTKTEKFNASKPRLSGPRKISSSASSIASTSSITKLGPSTTAADRPSSRLTVVSRSESLKVSVTRTVPPAGGPKSSVASSARSSPESVAEPSIKHRTRATSASTQATRTILSQVGSTTPSLVPDPESANLPPHASSVRFGGAEQTGGASDVCTTNTSRTSTPDLPSIDEGILPMWGDKLKNSDTLKTAGVLATPEMERWIEAGEGKQPYASKSIANAGGKRVGWADSDGNVSVSESEANTADSEDDEPTVYPSAYKGKTSADMKPTSSLPESSSMSPIRRPHIPAGALQLSPLRSSPLRGFAGGNGSNGNGGAQELLRAVVNDVMYEYRQETREDIKGLHLDLLRLGRSWKSELRSLMDEYVGDLKELKEENAKLRKENERLRRGF